MSDLFQVPALPDSDQRYAGYGLNGNPFQVDETLATIDAGNDAERFRRMMCALEIERLTALITAETYTESPRKLWLKEDNTAAKRFNNVVTTGIFRSLVGMSTPRVLPVYIPVPQVMDDFAGSVYGLIIDRLLPRYFKNAAYAFLYQELKRVSGGDPDAGPFNAVELLEAMDATDGLALDEILYGHEFSLTEAEEYGVLVEAEKDMDEMDEMDEMEEMEEVVAEVEEPIEEDPEDPRRAAILAFAVRRLNDASYGFGNTLKLAVQTGLGDSFVKARIILQQANSPKEELLGLVRFIGRYYNGVVVFIDQLDPWLIFTDQEKIKFLSSVHEFDLISGGRAVLTSVSNAEVYDAFDTRYKNECETVPLRLSWLGKNTEELGRDEVFRRELVAAFIEKAGGVGTGPFTEDGIATIFSAAEGRIPAALDMCRDMVDAGIGQDFSPIDGAFVKRQA